MFMEADIIVRFAGTMPAKVVLQLTTAFREGGLCNRNGTFSYKDHLRECQTHVLALAGDKDLICPPDAVYGRQCMFLFSTSLIASLCRLLISVWAVFPFLRNCETHSGSQGGL